MAVASRARVPVLRYHLGMAYTATENPVGAKEELNKALELADDREFPGIEEARATLKTLEQAPAASS
jgi:Tfp pilus assembly protein PilF